MCVCVCVLVRRIRRKLDRTQTFTTSKHLKKPLIKIILFTFVCAGSSLPNRLSRGEAGLLSGCGARVSHCGGSSCYGAQALGCAASVVAASGLQSTGSVVVAHGLSGSMAHRILPDQGWNRWILYH